jgi:hypothetical protein
MPRIIAVALAAALSSLLLAAPASAQLLTFVAATGNDANICLSQASPRKTPPGLQACNRISEIKGEPSCAPS